MPETENTQIRGPSPQPRTTGPKPAGEGPSTPPAEACQNKAGCACEASGVEPDGCPFFRAPAAEAFALADFDQAQKVLEEIRSAKAYARALSETFPEASHIKVNTERLRQHLATIISKLDFAERACMQLGLPF